MWGVSDIPDYKKWIIEYYEGLTPMASIPMFDDFYCDIWFGESTVTSTKFSDKYNYDYYNDVVSLFRYGTITFGLRRGSQLWCIDQYGDSFNLYNDYGNGIDCVYKYALSGYTVDHAEYSYNIRDLTFEQTLINHYPDGSVAENTYSLKTSYTVGYQGTTSTESESEDMDRARTFYKALRAAYEAQETNG